MAKQYKVMGARGSHVFENLPRKLRKNLGWILIVVLLAIMGVTYLSGWLASEYNLSPSVYGVLDDVSALLGGGFVAICDTAARTLFAPYEIPVGIIMAFIGSPFFIFILIKRKRGESRD